MGKMVINRLRKDELEYELKVRGIKIGTVEEMRSSLAATLRLEKDNESFSYPAYPFTFKQDETAILAKCKELETAVSKLVGKPGAAEESELQTRITHVLGRIDRMVTGDDEDSKTIKSELFSQF